MRRKLTYNYWLMIIAWCMFLNGYNLLADMFGLAACAVLSTINKRINHWRFCLVGLIIYMTVSLFLKDSNITYFFPKLSIFLAIICLDCSLTNEYQFLIKSRFLVPYMLVMIISLATFAVVTLILPNSLYTIFTKRNLYMMDGLIFLPYLIPCLYIYCYKRIINIRIKNRMQNKGAT